MMQILLTSLLIFNIVFIFIGLGLFVLQKLGATCPSTGEKLFFSFGIGAGIVGYTVFALASLQLLYPMPIITLLVLLLIAACYGWRFLSFAEVLQSLQLPQTYVEKLSLAAVIALLGASFLLAMTPEIGKDALVYHLGVPALYLKHHGFYFIDGNIFSNLPLHTEMLFMIGLFLQGDILAKAIAFVVLPVILLGMSRFAIHKMEKNSLPYLSMLIFIMIPSVFVLSTTAYIDLYVALYVFGAVYSFFLWQENRERSWLLLCGLFTGLALSCKYNALFFPFLGLFGILWSHRKSVESKLALNDVCKYIMWTAAWGIPFYLKNWILTDNPFYPFMYGIFGGKGLDPEQVRLFHGLYKYMGMGREWFDYVLLPFNVSFRAEMNSIRFDGIVGPLFFLVLPFLLGIKKISTRPKEILILCGTYFLFWASASQDIRYLTPILPFLCLLSGLILSNYLQQKSLSFFLSIVTIVCLIINGYIIIREFIKINPIAVVTGTEDKEKFLDRSLSHYAMYRSVNKLPTDAKVLLVYMKNMSFLCKRNCYSDSMLEHYTLKKILNASSSPEDARNELKSMGFTHIMYDDVFVTGNKSFFSTNEKEIFSSFQQKYLQLLYSKGTYRLYNIS